MADHPLNALADEPPARVVLDVAPPPGIELPHVDGLLTPGRGNDHLRAARPGPAPA